MGTAVYDAQGAHALRLVELRDTAKKAGVPPGVLDQAEAAFRLHEFPDTDEACAAFDAVLGNAGWQWNDELLGYHQPWEPPA